jgi:hypothetical protein
MSAGSRHDVEAHRGRGPGVAVSTVPAVVAAARDGWQGPRALREWELTWTSNHNAGSH